jgi:hypothetical protein
MENDRITNYAEFWDFYVAEHTHPLTRLLHFAGTSLSIVLLFWFVKNETYRYLPLCLVVGYGFAWFSHFVIEKNKPASFKYPLWSFISDYKMMFYMLTGKMNAEVERVSNK